MSINFFVSPLGQLIIKKATMKATENTLTKRELMLLLPEVGETINPFGYAHKLCASLRAGVITFEQFDMLCGDLQLHCEANNIETKNEIASLF